MIVTYNSAAELGACLDALSSKAPDMMAIVVDNASTDSTRDLVRARKQIRLIENAANRGFAAAANQGVAASDASFVLLLNPDAQILTEVTPLIDAARQHGLAAGQLVGADHQPQAGFTIRRFPTPLALAFEVLGINRIWKSNRVNRNYRYLDKDLTQPAFVEQPAGAFLMTRRDVWEQLNGLDERFFPVWFEDVDFCKRATGAGYKIAYVPHVRALHAGAHSIRQIPPESRAVYWYDSLLKYSTKHFGPSGYRAVCIAVMLGSVPRAIGGMIRTRTAVPVVTYARIFWVAVLYLLNRQRSVGSAGSI